MPSQQHSFVVRCWQLGSHDERLEIEHVQTGHKRLARSTAEAIEWISGFAREQQPHDRPAPLSIRQERGR